MKRVINKASVKSESAVYEYKGYTLCKCQGFWFAFAKHVCYATSDGPTDTLGELKLAIDNEALSEW